jgi:hypothetical protein
MSAVEEQKVLIGAAAAGHRHIDGRRHGPHRNYDGTHPMRRGGGNRPSRPRRGRPERIPVVVAGEMTRHCHRE